MKSGQNNFVRCYYQLMNRSLAQSMCFTKYLIERDALSVAFSRIGSGFCRPSTIADAKYHLQNIQKLIVHVEEMAPLPSHQIVARDYHHLMEKSCCGRD